MNWWIIALTFLAVNLDFFFILIFLLDQYKVKDVLIGYLIGILILVSASFFAGKILATFLPEWILGILGVLPIYMAFHDDDDPSEQTHRNPIIATLVTYLAVCAGCNLAIFLPVLTNVIFGRFAAVLIFIAVLAVLVVLLVNMIGQLSPVKKVMEHYGEIAMKIIYIGVGLYVFWDSGLISHLIKLIS